MCRCGGHQKDQNHRHIVTIVTLSRGPASAYGPSEAGGAARQNGMSFSDSVAEDWACGAPPAVVIGAVADSAAMLSSTTSL